MQLVLLSNIAIVFRKPYKLTSKESKKEPDSKLHVFLFSVLNDFKILINCFVYWTLLCITFDLFVPLKCSICTHGKKTLLYPANH